MGRFLFEGTKKAPKLDCSDVAQLSQYTKEHFTVHFKWVNMVCELNLNKAFFPELKQGHVNKYSHPTSSLRVK